MNCGTHYLRANLDEELRSSLAGELLLPAKLQQGSSRFHVSLPIVVPIPSLEIDGLYADE
jgi:hypothetical protein